MVPNIYKTPTNGEYGQAVSESCSGFCLYLEPGLINECEDQIIFTFLLS